MWQREGEIIKEVAVPLNGSGEVAGVLPARQKQRSCLKSGTKGGVEQPVPDNRYSFALFADDILPFFLDSPSASAAFNCEHL